MRLLFVCLGNICRSPTAEGVMAELLRREGLDARVQVDSAGTGDWHVGGPPDDRAVAAAARRGIALTSIARQVTSDDLRDADLVLAMDARNLRDLLALQPAAGPRAEVRRLREFDPRAVGDGDLDVPDPYLGDGDGFAAVLGQIQAACAGLLDEVRRRLDAGAAREGGVGAEAEARGGGDAGAGSETDADRA